MRQPYENTHTHKQADNQTKNTFTVANKAFIHFRWHQVETETRQKTNNHQQQTATFPNDTEIPKRNIAMREHKLKWPHLPR